MSYQGSSKLKTEIDQWVAEGIIAPEQAQLLYDKYGLLAPAPWYRRTDFIISAVAIVLGALGAILIISNNWDSLGQAGQMAMGLLPLLVTYYFGIRAGLAGQRDRSELLMFLGGLLYGMNIYLQAQIFHIDAYWPDGVLWWMIGLLLPMLYFGGALHQVLLHVLFQAWLNTQIFYEKLHPSGYLIFALLLWLLYYRPNPLVLVLAIVNTWVVIFRMELYVARQLQVEVAQGWWMPIVAGALLLYMLLDRLHHQYNERFLHGLKTWLVNGLLVLVFCTTIGAVLNELLEAGVSLFALALFAGGVWLYVRDKDKTPQQHYMLVVAGVLLALNLAGWWHARYLMAAKEGEDHLSLRQLAALLAGFMNLVFLGLSIYRVWYGRKHHLKGEFMLGVAMVLVLTMARFINIIGDYVTGGLLFIGCAVLLVGLNKYWNRNLPSDGKTTEVDQ